MKTGVISCGNSNITSVVNALHYIGLEAMVLSEPDTSCDLLIMPGVGSFDSGMFHLEHSGFYSVIRNHIASGKPFIGICLGMQMLFESSEEGITPGLSIFKGRLCKLVGHESVELKNPPNIGYNYVDFSSKPGNKSVTGECNGYYYFLHSYALKEAPDAARVLGKSIFSEELFFPFFLKDNVCGIQFHPERSGRRGLALMEQVVKTIL